MSDQSPRMKACIASGSSTCKGRGVITTTQTPKLYRGVEVEEAIPCPCRMKDLGEVWLDPIRKMYSQSWEWGRGVRSEIDQEELARITPDRNVLIEASKAGGLLWVTEALKSHAVKHGWQAMLPYLAASEQELDDYHFRRNGDDYSGLREIQWGTYKVIIVTLGYLPKSVLVRYMAVRLNMLISMGIRVWLIYHHSSPPQNHPENFCWSEEMAQLTSDWERLQLSGSFARTGRQSRHQPRTSSAPATSATVADPLGDDEEFGPNG